MIKYFIDWFKMHPPESGTSEQWQAFDEGCKHVYPIRYWLNEKLIPNTWDPCMRFLIKIKNQIRYRFIQRFHIIDTKLKPAYYDTDYLIINGMFSLLVDFIEVEKAWMQTISEDLYKKPSWYKWRPFTRSKKLGLEYLDWEINLKNKSNELEINTSQSDSAEIQKELYLWWTEKRPARKDPYDLMSGPEFIKGGDIDYMLKNNTPEIKKIYEEINKLEEEYYNEDSEMLIKLIKVRSSLWT